MPRPNQGVRLAPKPINGVWYLTWTVDGRSCRRSTGTGRRAEAEQYLAHFILERDRLDAEAEAPVVPTVAQVMAAYREGHIAENELPSADQWRACSYNVEHHPKLGKRLASEVTPEDVKEYGKDRFAGKVGYVDDGGVRRGYRKGGAGAFRLEIQCLNAALKWCVVNRKFSGFTLADFTPVPLPANPPPRSHYWTVEQANAVLDYAKARAERTPYYRRLWLFILIGLDTASRKEPILTLTWDRVRLWQEDGEWRGEVDFQVPGRRVTRKRRGKNDLSPEVAATLVAERARATTPYVLGHDGEIGAFRNLTSKVLGRPYGPHIMRHSWATWAVSNGVSIVEAAAVLHDHPATVARHYGHLLPEKRRAAVNLVAALRSPANANGPGTPAPAGENARGTDAR